MLVDPRGMFMPALPPSMRCDPSVTATPVRDRGVTTGWIVSPTTRRTATARATTGILSNNGGAKNA